MKSRQLAVVLDMPTRQKRRRKPRAPAGNISSGERKVLGSVSGVDDVIEEALITPDIARSVLFSTHFDFEEVES